MAEDSLIASCSPTLAGIKVGSLFNHRFSDVDAMRVCIREWNRKLRTKGITAVPLRYEEGKALIYLYRPAMLKKNWSDNIATLLLLERGYDVSSVQRSVVHLIKRISEEEVFPHEIGLFLDYPPEDVQGFIEHKAANFKCSGLWKVYGDVNYAKSMFEKYNRCKSIYMERFANGETIEQLAVAI